MIQLSIIPRLNRDEKNAIATALTRKAPWNSKAFLVKNYKARLIKLMKRQTLGCCCYCGCFFSRGGSGPELDHFIPQHFDKKKIFEPTNLILSCHLCNATLKNMKVPLVIPKKRKRYTKDHFSIFHPYYHKTKDHFTFHKRKVLVEGKSLIGRQSISYFELDKADRLEWRYTEDHILNVIFKLSHLKRKKCQSRLIEILQYERHYK